MLANEIVWFQPRRFWYDPECFAGGFRFTIQFVEQSMSILQSILHSAQCRNLHQRIALEALDNLKTVPAQRLSKILLKYYQAFFSGVDSGDRCSKGSSDQDSKSHSDHTNAACAKCVQWFDTALKRLDEGRLKKAAYACGALSYHFTSSMLPLHLDKQKSNKSSLHPLAWTIYKDYDAIQRHRSQIQCTAKFEFSHDDQWLSRAVLAGTNLASGRSDRLNQLYFYELWTDDLPNSLAGESLDLAAELVSLAVGGWAGVLCRLADEATLELPEVSLTSSAILAAIDTPFAWIFRRFSDRSATRRARLWDRPHATSLQSSGVADPIVEVDYTNDDEPNCASEIVALSVSDRGLEDTNRAIEQPISKESFTPLEPTVLKMPSPRREPKQPSSAPIELATSSTDTTQLHYNSPLADAPSIGPKTAKRFEKLGIRTVGQFIHSDAQQLEAKLDVRWISSHAIRDWQDQARLVCEMPSLRDYQSQLLVAIGVRTSGQLCTLDASRLAEQIVSFCDTSEGQQLLRFAKSPSYRDVFSWIEMAQRGVGFQPTKSKKLAS